MKHYISREVQLHGLINSLREDRQELIVEALFDNLGMCRTIVADFNVLLTEHFCDD